MSKMTTHKNPNIDSVSYWILPLDKSESKRQTTNRPYFLKKFSYRIVLKFLRSNFWQLASDRQVVPSITLQQSNQMNRKPHKKPVEPMSKKRPRLIKEII